MAFVAPPKPTSGFQGTVNHYGVGMWDRANNNIQQWIKVDFTAYEDGRVDAPITLQNNTYYGFKGSITLTVKDYDGNQILEIVSPEYAIGPKSPLHADTPNQATQPWQFNTSPDVGIYGAQLLGVPAAYSQDALPLGLNFGQIEQVAAAGAPILAAAV